VKNVDALFAKTAIGKKGLKTGPSVLANDLFGISSHKLIYSYRPGESSRLFLFFNWPGKKTYEIAKKWVAGK